MSPPDDPRKRSSTADECEREARKRGGAFDIEKCELERERAKDRSREERERLSGKLPNPELRLNAKVKDYIDKKIPAEAERAELYHLFSVYEYVPENIDCARCFLTFRDLLSHEPVMLFFDYLVHKLNYKFEISFPEQIYGLVKYGDYEEALELEKIKGEKPDDEVAAEWRDATDKSLTEYFEKFKADNIDSPKFSARLKVVQDKFGMPLSFVGMVQLMAMDEGEMKKISASKATTEDIKRKTEPLFKGNEMLFCITGAEHPEQIDGLAELLKGLKLKREPQNITIHQLSIMAKVKEDIDGLVKFWNWLEEEFIGFPLSLNNLLAIYSLWGKFEKKDPPVTFDKKLADQLKKTALRIGFNLSRDQILESLDSLLTWTEAELRALEELKKIYPVKFNSQSDVEKIHAGIKHIVDFGILGQLIDKDVSMLYKAMLGEKAKEHNEYQERLGGIQEREEFDYVSNLVNADSLLTVFDKKISDTKKILVALARTGVQMKEICDLDIYSPENIGGSATWGIIASIVRSFKKNPQSLFDWEKFSAPYNWDYAPILLIRDWVDLPSAARQELMKPSNAELFNLLQQEYGFQLTPATMQIFARQLASGGATDSYLAAFKTDELKTFYRSNTDLFPKNKANSMFPNHEGERIIAIAQLYAKHMTDKRFLRWARKWHDLGNEIGQYFTDQPERLKILDDPMFPRLVKAMGYFGQKIEILDSAEKLLPHVKTLESKEFREFHDMLVKKFNLDQYSLNDSIELFGDRNRKKFLENKDVQIFYAKIKEYGFDFRGEHTQTIIERCDLLKELYETPGLAEAPEQINNAFGVNIKNDVRNIESGESDPLSRGLAMISGLETRGYDFFVEIAALKRSGDFDLLISADTRNLIQFCKTKFGYTFSPLHISSIISVMKSDRLKQKIYDPKTQNAFAKLNGTYFDGRLIFSFNLLDALIDIANNYEQFSGFVSVLEQNFGYKLENPDDIFTLADLAPREEIVKKLKSKETISAYKKLATSKGYKFSLKDVYAIIYLADEPKIIDPIYDREMDSLAEELFGRSFGHNLAARMEFYEVYKDPVYRKKMANSEDFRTLRVKLQSSFGVRGSTSAVKGYLDLLEHPEVITFLETVGYTEQAGSVVGSGEIFDAVPSLVEIAKTNAGSYVAKFRKKYAFYNFKPLDGPAWQSIISMVPNPEDLAAKTHDLNKKLNTKIHSVSDLYVTLILGDNLDLNRARLEQDAAKNFGDDIHRVDSNFDSYGSYNQVSKFSLLQLNKIKLMQQWFEKDENKKSIGVFLKKDVENYPYTELGSLFVLRQDGQLDHQEYPPERNFNNGSYSPPVEAKNKHSIALATGHLHALKHGQGLHAGPSGSRFTIGGDMTVTQVWDLDAFVITSISDKEFVVHFYTPEGNVAFLGKYTHA